MRNNYDGMTGELGRTMRILKIWTFKKTVLETSTTHEVEFEADNNPANKKKGELG